MRENLPEGFKDAGLVCWLCFMLFFAYGMVKEGIERHAALLQWLIGGCFWSLLAFPLLMLAYSRWFKGER